MAFCLVQDIASGELLEIDENVFQCEWWSKDKLVYSRSTKELRSDQIMEFDFQSRKQRVLMEESDQKRFLVLGTTKDGKIVHVSSMTKNTSEIIVLNDDEGEIEMRVVLPREDGVMYFLDHMDGVYFIVSNDRGCTEYRVDAVVGGLDLKRGKTIVPHEENCSIEDLEVKKGILTLFCRDVETSRQFVKVYRIVREGTEDIKAVLISQIQSEEYPSVRPGLEDESDSREDVIGLRVSSPTRAERDVTLEVSSLRTLESLSSDTNSPADKFCTWEIAFVSAHDGERIPLTVIRPRESSSASRPGVLFAYGAYGHSLELKMEESYLSLVEDGWTVFLAHVRGGAEKGQRWYAQGKLANKMNSFKDLESCAEFILRSGLVTDGKLAAHGVSAGGLLVAGLVNFRPDLFKAIVLRVPFLSVLNSMTQPSEELTHTEYEEWGNPVETPEIRMLMERYDPLLNLTEQVGMNYPHALITASIKDNRVSFTTVSEYVSKLRSFQKLKSPEDRSIIVFDVDEEHGHFGENTLAASFETQALEMAFLKHVLLKSI
jgi:oligopeptidase B